jgi:hypothetical protein
MFCTIKNYFGKSLWKKLTLPWKTYSRVFMSTRSQTSRPRKTSTQVFIRIKIQVIYLASNTEIEHTFAEGGLLWLDE